MRLDAFLSYSGVASRRRARDLVLSGRVRVDGDVVTSGGHRLVGRETVTLDGEVVRPPTERTYIMLNKPRGYITTASDPRGRPTVAELVPRSPRLFPVGRLDFSTSGLLLMTDDGDWAASLEHPGGGLSRVYRVLVEGEPSEKVLADLRRGIRLADGIASIDSISRIQGNFPEGQSAWRIALGEGRYREVRRLMATVGHPVMGLKRIGFGPVGLGSLPVGKWRHLRPKEVDALGRLARANRDGKRS